MSELSYRHNLDTLFEAGFFSLNQSQKSTILLNCFRYLHVHHAARCEEYQRISALMSSDLKGYEDLPYLAVRLFKLHELKSIPNIDVFKTLTSSGTTGQIPARIFLDKETSARQSKVLVNIMQQFIGKQRLPMLIIDSPSSLKNAKFSARNAGIQGMAFFGREHAYALHEDMSLNLEVVNQFVEKHKDKPVLLFGFTFMVWLNFIQALKKQKVQLSFNEGKLVHSGGWKKLIQQQVSNDIFKETVYQVTQIEKVHNFYGMAEQVGSVFVECEKGYLHAPPFADLIIRDPYTLKPMLNGETGLIQVLSVIPTSYPGYSLLTEDVGTVLGEDDCKCGRLGRYFRVEGRLPKTEVRGCSDTAGVSHV
ncbi:LuxE/PaaK family acyltransferase [Alteromonas sp. ASW11-130]|uniref:LuxE/PaaK family acyltransferase n=1 Tax=Alteromonas sp. ASW11-130 TaxID=3015775 RepID=UPI0022425C56|nr:acyl-protein synthetase [Alteromonas sp. ASW11-130]MCW8090339.1 acyl-protein synthetase [Alteromonas sp. ASW11-130]